MATATFTSRTVESTDPSLSAESNRLVTQELRRVIGRDRVSLPNGAADHRSEQHATHSSLMAAALSIKFEIFLVGLIVAMATLIAVSMALESWFLMAFSFALLFPAAALVATSVMKLFDDHEHLDPDTAARLSAEGVGDPDHMFNELVHDFDGGASTR